MSVVKTSRRRQNSPRNSSSGAAVSSTRVFLCSDGTTRVLYEILGGGGGSGRATGRSNANTNAAATTTTVFVVCHDLFDCLDATKLLFLDLVRRHPECRILVYNQPGQAGTTFPVKAKGIGTSNSSADNTKQPQPQPQRTVALNNDFHADILYQLLCHVRSTGELPVDSAAACSRNSSIALHLIGIGNGVSVLLSLLDQYGSSDLFKLTGSSADGGSGSAVGDGSGDSILKSLISINGYATIDAQLAGILHSAKNAFMSFPANRPDLPISYLSHYMFSDEYIDKVSMDLALSIYTAVLNPISLEGRIRLVDGALKNRSIHHVDKLLERFGIPIIAIQSTGNRVVAPSNVDALLQGRRNASHIWSHDLRYNNTATAAAGKENDCYAQVGLTDMLDKCFQRDGSCMQDASDVVASSEALPPPSSLAIFVRAGHAIAQECKGPILGLLDRLVSPQSFPCGACESRQDGATRKTDTLRLSPPLSSTLPTPAKEEGRTRSSKAAQKDEKWRRGGKKSTISGGDGDKGKGKKNGKKSQESRPEIKSNCKSMAPIGKQNGGIPPSKERQTTRGRARKKKREPKSAASSRRNPTRNGPSASQACDGAANDWAKEESLQGSESPLDSVENVESTSITPYIVKGAPRCSLNEIISPTGAGADKPLEEKISGKVPQLQDYITRGIPTELIPTEIKAGSPTVEQMRHRRWEFSSANPTIAIPPEMTRIVTHTSPPTVEELELGFYKELVAEREREARRMENERRKATREVDHSDVKNEQMKRSLEYQREDKQQLDKLREENLRREKERAQHQLQRRIEVDEMENSLIRSGLVDPYMPAEGEAPPIRSLPPTRFIHLASSSSSRIDPCHLATTKLDGILDVLDNDAELAATKGMRMTVNEFEQIRRKLRQQHLEKEMELRRMTSAERHVLFMRKARDIQRTWRGHQGRMIAAGVLRDKRRKDTVYNAVVLIQKCRRGSVGRIVACEKRDEAIRFARTIAGAGTIQRCWRGCVGRRVARLRRQELLAIICQSMYRGHRGRTVAINERHHQERIRLENSSAIKIQCMWRIGIALEECRLQLIRRIASIDLQRIVRGHIARRKATKMRIWATTEPGPARIELGLRLIKESQDEFERQRDDIDGLHRAQEIAETRVNRMFRTLKESEKELAHLQKELDDLESPDEIQGDGADDEEEIGNNAKEEDVSKALISSDTDTLEREKRRRYLQSEVQDVLSKVNEKRTALASLETKISDMEATRERKDREFKRMQRDLMELLSDQKDELDELRERGMELETVTATTAVAAAATAQKARDHEIQTNKMFHRQEELMKFQFMSMSLSYMSSLGMLKQMKNMASDATATAVSCSADTAAAAAAAAAAANLPSPSSEALPSHLASRLSVAQTKGSGFEPSTDKMPQGDAGVKGLDTDADEPLPQDCHGWTVGDVSKWLRKLSLGIYAGKFAEASVDGEFLLELKEDDLGGVLGMKHKLHRRKLILAREKLSLSPEEGKRRDAAVRFVDDDVAPSRKRTSMSPSSLDQESSLLVSGENHHHHYNQQRNRRRLAMPFALGSVPSPAAGVVFSHARHGRLKRLEESLDEGFDIDAKDDQGNTLLMTAVQNGNKKAVDMLIRRGSTLNHMNGNGNTALHYALAYDTTGEIATYLIERGADDTIENRQGLSAYDGLGDDDPGTVAGIEEDDDGEEEEDLDVDSTVNDSRIEMVVAANI